VILLYHKIITKQLKNCFEGVLKQGVAFESIFSSLLFVD